MGPSENIAGIPELVLLRLWQQPATTIAALSASIGSPPEVIRLALDTLQNRGCILERTPTGIELLSTSINCWRDILEHEAARLDWLLARQVQVYQQTTSTNDLCARAADSGAPHGLTILADVQTSGRGRRGHTWLAKPGQSVLMSILLRNAPTPSEDSLTLLVGLAAAEALESLGLPQIQIKWPNDLLVDGRKIAGILVERRGSNTILGLGINAMQSASDFPAELKHRATSLFIERHTRLDRLRLIVALLTSFHARSITSPPPESSWIDAWRSRCPMLGQTLTAWERSDDPNAPRMKVHGRILDIDPLRGLLIKDETGAQRWLSAHTTTLSAE